MQIGNSLDVMKDQKIKKQKLQKANVMHNIVRLTEGTDEMVS
jgi:hypothetical protein